jgi:hypothetical protein
MIIDYCYDSIVNAIGTLYLIGVIDRNEDGGV